MFQIGKLPVTLTLGQWKYVDDFHIYPNVTVVLRTLLPKDLTSYQSVIHTTL